MCERLFNVCFSTIGFNLLASFISLTVLTSFSIVQEDVAYIFALADEDKSGNLTAKEFKDCLELIRERYPQIDLYLDRQHLQDVMKILDDPKTYGEGDSVLLDIEQFKKALTKVDAQMKTLPATAQVTLNRRDTFPQIFHVDGFICYLLDMA